MLVEGYNIHDMFTNVLEAHTRADSPFARYALFAVLVPTITVAVSAAVWPDGYGNVENNSDDTLCWLSTDGDRLIWAFIVPMALMLLINFVFLVRVLRVVARAATRRTSSLHRTSSVRLTSEGNENIARARRALKASFSFGTVMGLGWIFGIIALADSSFALQVLFAVFAGLQ